MSKNKKKHQKEKDKRHFETPVAVDQPTDSPDVVRVDEEIGDEFPAADEVTYRGRMSPEGGVDEVEYKGEDLDRAADQVQFGSGVGAFGNDDVEFGQDTEEQRPRRNDDVEAAAEVAPTAGPMARERDEQGAQTQDQGNVLGTVSIILSVLAFFLVPFLLGPAGIVLGIISARRGSRLGWWAVGLGSVAIILTVFIAPIVGF
ncbi:hypothetical protein [Salinithrix halophila]|uniref:DUF4190 domain-containing protein n=1 Tax=Salinithrix halophila TaxID=1485204 RepID=A0ABV8JD36_9BACL